MYLGSFEATMRFSFDPRVKKSAVNLVVASNSELEKFAKNFVKWRDHLETVDETKFKRKKLKDSNKEN